MSSLLPRTPHVDPPEGESRVVNFRDDGGEMIAALGSENTRAILNLLYEEPRTPSDLADTLELSIQNISYHLEKLQNVGLVTVVDTWYSSKGQRMSVYAPTADPLVIILD